MITKHYSAEKMAQEISHAILRNLDEYTTWYSFCMPTSKGLFKDWKTIICPERSEVTRIVRDIVSEKRNVVCDVCISTEEPYPGDYELRIEYQLVYGY